VRFKSRGPALVRPGVAEYPGAARAVANALKADPEDNGVAVLGHFARAFGQETSKTVLANVARLWRGDREGRSRGVQAPRPARSAALPAREPGMTRPLLAGLLVALLSAMPAAADHCSPGQFYRVRLNQCVGLNTRLASAYVHAAASRSATPGREIRLRFPSSPRRNLSASPRLSSRSSCRRSMTGRRQVCFPTCQRERAYDQLSHGDCSS
jgi:hypothetical protein